MSSEAVLVDFGGTLDSDGVHWSTRLAQAFVAAGAVFERARLDQAFFASERELAALETIGEFGLDAYVRTQVELMARDLASDVAISTVAESLLRSIRASLARSRGLLLERRGRRRFGLVSNFYANLPRILSETGLDPCFDALSISSLVGAEKPAAALFEDALVKLGVEPPESIMIGDSLTSDVMPAKALGMRTVWIQGDEIFGNGDPAAADHVARSLRDALAWVDRSVS